MQDFLKGLSETQRQAVLHTRGPLAVFAGAGSGKTRVITYRIANLILEGTPPSAILALTFTNKAAGEMRERIRHILPQSVGSIAVGTFHSICARWLREFGSYLGFRSDFTIYDDADSLSAMKAVTKQLYPKSDLGPIVADMMQFVESAKIFGQFPDEFEGQKTLGGRRISLDAVKVYQEYQNYLHRCQAMDFGDLIMNTVMLLRRSKPVRTILQKRFRHVLVDEFQDTNPTQLEIVETLCAEHRNLFVVGDDDQSIYSWRGANPSNLIDFHKRYPDAGRVVLGENYRSTTNIISAANAVISHNRKRVEKQLFSNIPAGEKIVFHQESDGELEAWYVVDMIKRDLSKYHYSDFAIFYRTNSQSRLIEEALRREQIPYRIFGAVKFYDRLEIKDILAYFRLFLNADDDVSFRRIVNVPSRGIGAKAVESLEMIATERSVSLLEAARLSVASAKLNPKIAQFLTVFDEAKRLVMAASLSEAVSELVKATGYFEYLRKKFPQYADDRIENVQELGSALGDFKFRSEAESVTLADWMQTIALDKSGDDSDGEDGVSLMTLHTAKGLEFQVVFVVGTEVGLIPHRNSVDDAAAQEEERRLFYVGMTRAMRKLTMTSAVTRQVYGQFMSNLPSSFLAEIPRDLVDWQVYGDVNEALGYEDTPSFSYEYDLEVGSRVSHPVYGRGVIESLIDMGIKKATVRFTGLGARVVPVSHLSAESL